MRGHDDTAVGFWKPTSRALHQRLPEVDMGALPSPDLPPGAHQELVRALHDLHHRAGWPSLRTLARQSGVSHTTVSKVMSSTVLPQWGTVELLVEAMGGSRSEFHALWLSASSAGDGSAPAPAPRIAGRDAELAVVRDHLDGGGGLLVVTGEAGIGKSTLVGAAAALTDTRVAVGRCLPFSTEVPLMPVVELLRSIHDSDGGRWIGEALSGCPAYAREALARLLPELGAESGSTDDVDFAQQHLYAAVAAVLARLAASGPLAVVVEDLHVSDATTLDLLEYVLARGVEVPVAVTWRLDDQTVPRWRTEWLARIEALAAVRTVSLGPLTLEETRDQLRLAGWLADSPSRARRIHDRSRGHPLFTAHLAIQGDDPSLPPLLADLLDRRLGDLSPEQDRVATALGVADGPVDVQLLAAAAGLDEDAVLVALRHLAARHLVSVGAVDTVRLAHPLLAEAARRRLLRAEVRRLHRTFAELLGRAGGADPAVVAEHWRLSGEPSEEARWRAAAARQARRRTDPRSEADHWLRVLELGREHVVEPDDLVTAWLSAFDALQLSGRLEACAALVDEGQPDVDALADEQAAKVLRRAAQVAWLVGDDPETAVELAGNALDRLAGRPVGAGLVHVLDQRASTLMDLARYDEATRDLEVALEACAELDDDALYFQTAATLAWHVGHLGDLAAALDLFRRARSRVRGTAGPWREAHLAMLHTDVLLQHHRPPQEVEEAARRVLELAREWQLDFHLLTVVKANVVEAYLDAGRTGDAAARLVDVPRSPSYDDWPGLWVSARLDIVRGRTDDAIATMRALVKAGDSARHRLDRAVWEATALLWQDEPARAWAALRDPLAAFLDSPGIVDYWMAFLVLARAAADLPADRARRGSRGDPTALEVLEDLEDLRRAARRDPLDPQRSSAGVAAGVTWEAELVRARSADTVDHWSRAAVAWGHLGRPHAAAYCRWRAAQVALRERRGAVATRLLRRAAADASEHVPLSRAIAETSQGSTAPHGTADEPA
ncbi:AAA family ATPase [Nocardioides sp. STR2]|uniref:AAA family ATPase n=1 Tax=Nocardioides pini TaxID=2975053 RepID=A0ABT4CG18_9ACTN|nr:AAA family ATPase [Nocardioides pini]MCY4727089.1 AAA family ATPase [Nocardioides pini]